MSAPRLALVAVAALSCACATPAARTPFGFPEASLPIDLERFAGDWYVVAHLPLSPEANAVAEVESYALRGDGTIDIRTTFCEGAADGPFEEFTMTGWVHDERTNAEWRVRPFWPLALGYQILELDPDYGFTVIGHPSKSYAWVMAREREPSESRVEAAIERLRADGFAMESLRRVPQPAESCRG